MITIELRIYFRNYNNVIMRVSESRTRNVIKSKHAESYRLFKNMFHTRVDITSQINLSDERSKIRQPELELVNITINLWAAVM